MINILIVDIPGNSNTTFFEKEMGSINHIDLRIIDNIDTAIYLLNIMRFHTIFIGDIDANSVSLLLDTFFFDDGEVIFYTNNKNLFLSQSMVYRKGLHIPKASLPAYLTHEELNFVRSQEVT